MQLVSRAGCAAIGDDAKNKVISDISGKFAELDSMASKRSQITSGMNKVWDKALKAGPVSQESVKKMSVAESLFTNDAMKSSAKTGGIVRNSANLGLAFASAGKAIYDNDKKCESEKEIYNRLQDVKKSGITDLFNIKLGNKIVNNVLSGKSASKDLNTRISK
jgi:hypothetical protein